MNDIEFSLKPSPTEWEIVSLILARMLFNQARTWSRNDERIPTVVMFFAVMDICSREYQSQRNTVLIDDIVPFGSQLSSICWVFPYFFPPSQGLKQFGYQESATATLFLLGRHTLSGSGSTSFGTLLLQPTAESTCELCSPRNTRAEAFSTDSLYAGHTRSHSTACVVRQAVSLVCIPSSSASECSPLPLPRTHH
jgi:hypothetical protein